MSVWQSFASTGQNKDTDAVEDFLLAWLILKYAFASTSAKTTAEGTILNLNKAQAELELAQNNLILLTNSFNHICLVF